MTKLAVVGQDTRHFVDCSEVIPIPKPAVKKPATQDISAKDIQQACDSPFPRFASDPGATETIIPHCPDDTLDCVPSPTT
ncbi:hypothetical protein M422DRAFT_784683 [Sphaerobolus stellatus SS14]|nr:hypothetical protein M422DRAFT_784683 [Sphaerobolus stellatus SS14]